MFSRTSYVLAVLLVLSTVALAGDWVRLWPVNVHGKWGYIDEHGKIKIKPQFDSAGFFGETGFGARVRIGDKWGTVNGAGKFGIPVENDLVGPGRSSAVRVRKNGQWGFWTIISGKGAVRDTFIAMPDCDSLGEFQWDHAPILKHGKWGFVDRSGALDVPAIYDAVLPMWDNTESRGKLIYIFEGKLNGKWGMTDIENNVYIPFAYDSLSLGASVLAAAKVNGKWGYVDMHGTNKIPFQYDSARAFERGWGSGNDRFGLGKPAAAVCQNGKWGLVDTSGQTLVPLQYQHMGRVGYSKTAVCIDGKWGFLDGNGAMAIPAQYDSAGRFGNWGPIQIAGKWGFINDKGKTMVAPTLAWVAESNYENSMIVRDSKGKFGFVIPQGSPPVLGWYDAVTPFYGYYAYVQKNGHWKYIDRTGKTFWTEP